jgi:hypothetical protein
MSLSARSRLTNRQDVDVNSLLYEAKYNLALLAKAAGSDQEATAPFSQLPLPKPRSIECQVCVSVEEWRYSKMLLGLTSKYLFSLACHIYWHTGLIIF